jgi:hypothetical protein
MLSGESAFAMTALEDINEFKTRFFGHRLVFADLGDDGVDKIKQLERGPIYVSGERSIFLFECR